MNRAFWRSIAALILTLASVALAEAQVCPPPCPCTLCQDSTVQKTCSGAERLLNPLGIGGKGRPSICSVVERVCDPICQQCTDLRDKCLGLTAQLPTTADLCRQAVDFARSAEKAVNATRKQLWSEFNSAVRKSGINVEHDIILYDLHGRATFTYNAYTGAAWYEVTLPHGVKIEQGKVKSSLAGNQSLPNIDPQVVINELGFFRAKRINPYDGWAAKKLAQKERAIYVSSKRFVDIVSLENVAQEVVWAIASGGQTAQGSIDALKEQLTIEWGDMLTWLRDVGVEKQSELAGEITKAVLENGFKAAFIPLKLGSGNNRFDIQIDIDVISYEYHLTPSVSGEIKKLLSLIGINTDKALAGVGTKVRAPHLAFSISLERTRQSPTATSQPLNTFLQHLQRGPGIDIGSVSDAVSQAIGVDLSKARQFQEQDGEGSIRSAFAKVFASAVPNELEKHYVGGTTFDLTNSRFAQELGGRLHGLMAGNAKQAQVTRLIVDVATATVTFDAELISKHRLARLNVMQELDKAWKAKDKAESNAFNDAHEMARRECDRLGDACRSLKSFQISPVGCGEATSYKKLSLEPLANPIPTISLPTEAELKQFKYPFPMGTRVETYKLSAVDPALTMTSPRVEIDYMYKTAPKFGGSCRGIFVSSKHILAKDCGSPARAADLEAQVRSTIYRRYSVGSGSGDVVFVEAQGPFALFQIPGSDEEMRGTVLLARERPRIGEPVLVVDDFVQRDAGVVRGCTVGPQASMQTLDIQCPSAPSEFEGWIFSAETKKLLGFVRHLDNSGVSIVGAVNGSQVLSSLTQEAPDVRVDRVARGFVPAVPNEPNDVPSSLAQSTMFLKSTYYWHPNEAVCLAVRISQDQALVLGCDTMKPDRLSFMDAKPLRNYRFALVAGETLQSGKEFQVNAQNIINRQSFMIVRAAMDDQVPIAALAARAPRANEPVIIVKAHPWERSTRLDCAIGPTRPDRKIIILCADGENLVQQPGSLIFSAIDGTLLAFVSGPSSDVPEVATVSSIGNSLKRLVRNP